MLDVQQNRGKRLPNTGQKRKEKKQRKKKEKKKAKKKKATTTNKSRKIIRNAGQALFVGYMQL